MSAGEPQLDRIQQHQMARFEAMGLTARPMSDGKSLLVSLRLGPAPFESIAGPVVIEGIVFSTVGHDRIKCLRPRSVFGMPLLDIRDCKSPAAIESVLRRAWRERTQALRETTRWLADRGIDAKPNRAGTAVGFALPGESPNARILMQDPHRAILPSAGPLSGLSLSSPLERSIEIGRNLESSADLECLFGARIESLRRDARKREEAHRAHGARKGPARALRPDERATRPVPRHHPKILLVGPHLIEDEGLRIELKRQGYRTATVRSDTEALLRLAGMTPDLVLSEYSLGRSDGATLVQATRSLVGIEVIPVILIDDVVHENRRRAARAVGAAGYVVHPPDKKRFVARLGRLLAESKERRFTRYPGRLSARLQGFTMPCIATEVGRGGVFIATEVQIDLHSAMLCELVLPDLGRDLSFEGEVLYRAEAQGTFSGLGLRFADISAEDEASLIKYLMKLESRR